MIEPKSVEWAIEVISAMVPDNIPDTWQIVPFDVKPKADASRIVVRAKTALQQLEGVRAFPVTITVDVFATDQWTEQLETIATAVESSFTDLTNPALINAGADRFKFLDLLGVTSDDPEAKKKTRHRSVTIEILAVEK
jgi:hypothetical protein